MCIIVAKEKGLELPKKETLETCFKHNPDGAGFMYVKDNKVIIDKGYMDFKSFYKRLKKLDKKLHLKDKALVMHFRIGTHGANNRQTTHPFPISNNNSDLKQTYFKTDLGMVHNGIIPHYDYEKDMSDTQLFIRDLVSILKGLNKNFYKDKNTLDMFEKVTNSKLCFLDTKNDLIYVGDFVKDENGIKYSNTTYKEYTYKTDWSKYDWDDYDRCYSTSYNTTTSDYEEKWDGGYEEDDYNEIEVEDFFREHVCTPLKIGDVVEFNDSSIFEIKERDTYFLDENLNLYEYYKGYMSLIGTDVVLYDNGIEQLQLEWANEMESEI